MKKFYNTLYLTSTILLLCIASGCGLDKKSKAQMGKAAPWTNIDSIVKQDHLQVISTIWMDSLIKNYMLLSKNEAVRAAIDSKLREEWLFDQIINTDSTVYFIYQIGHDVSDDGVTNSRFITDQWLYIDTTSRTIYEYDVIKDSLIRWAR